MADTFINDADVQVHLPKDRLKLEEIPDDVSDCKLDAERIVRGFLTPVIDAATIATWDSPENTPEIIRAITGRFCAALIYRNRYGEGARDDPKFAQNKYNEALSLLMKVLAGELEIPGVDVGTDFDNTWFEPNDSTDDPKFAMADRY